MTTPPLSQDQIASLNDSQSDALRDDYDSLGRQLARRGIDIETIKGKVAACSLAVPSWGCGRGGTRFAKFPIPGEPTNIFEKLDDCGVVQQLCRITPRVSPHFPWDKVSDYAALREHAQSLGLGFDAYRTDVSPILAMARAERGGAIETIAAYRASGWRPQKARERRAVKLGAGIV